MEDYLLSVSDVAKRLDISRNQTYDLINRGLIKTLKFKSLKVRNSEINRFLSEYEGKDLSDLDNIRNLDLN
ncbi:Helix-turn-helix domain protein [compost metagenome]